MRGGGPAGVGVAAGGIGRLETGLGWTGELAIAAGEIGKLETGADGTGKLAPGAVYGFGIGVVALMNSA